MLFLNLLFLVTKTESLLSTNRKLEICASLKCADAANKMVCGVKLEEGGFKLKLFPNECELLKYGCSVGTNEAYGVVNIRFCDSKYSKYSKFPKNINSAEAVSNVKCLELDCSYPSDTREICGIRNDSDKFRVKIFKDKCHMLKHNCEQNVDFKVTDLYICSRDAANVSDSITKRTEDKVKPNNVVIVDSSMFNTNGNINDTIKNFFATTHSMEMPMEELKDDALNETRRRLVQNLGPVLVFKPWITIPKNITDDVYHNPTLSSCYHKCPMKCPDTYAPVCGVPGVVAREPSLMFQNHCYMDMAQCKMRWEDKSPTAVSSAYIESTFLFCLGDEINGLYRLLPLVRTLQHMGRLKKKGRFHYRLRNMRFLNHQLVRQPNLMG